MKCMVAGFLLFVVIPLLLGHVVDLLLITPLRVPSDRTPVFYPSTVRHTIVEPVGTTGIVLEEITCVTCRSGLWDCCILSVHVEPFG